MMNVTQLWRRCDALVDAAELLVWKFWIADRPMMDREKEALSWYL